MIKLGFGAVAMVAAVGAVGALTGCSGSADAIDQSEGAASAASTFASGHYEMLDLVVAGGKISGHFRDSVGDPEHGGASCEFTFEGDVPAKGTKSAPIVAVDGFGSVTGTVSLHPGAHGKRGLVLKLDADPNACSRAAPMLMDAAGTQFDLTSKMENDSLGYRSVSADKAFFYDGPTKHARSAYVLRGDTVVVTGAEANGFLPVKFVGTKTTTGLVKTSDLASAAAPKPTPTAIGAGKYINAALGAMLLVHGPCSTENFLSNAQGQDVASGPLGTDQHTLTSPEGDVCGAYSLTQTEAGVVMVTWSPDPTAHLSADIQTGCKSIEGEYDMTVPGTLEACK